MKKWRRKDTVLVICGATSLVLLFTLFNFYVIVIRGYRAPWETYWGPRIRPLELSFLEGVICICFGIISLAGRGGISWYTVRTVIYLHIAKFLHGSDARARAKTHEIFQQDLWKSTSSVRTGLCLITAGIILVVLDFLIPH